MGSTRTWLLAGLAVLAGRGALAVTIDNDLLRGTIDSNLTAGLGIRAKQPSCARIGSADPGTCGGDVNPDQWANGDAGNRNYRAGQAFTGYLSLSSEAVLKMPSEQLKFMARGTLFYDPMAARTETTPLTGSASAQMVHRARLFDLWVQKDFTLGAADSHIRIGNQVVNWGESMYAMGGINATNALDIQSLLTPGTQIKQALLPADMVSVGTSVPGGVSAEAYYQFNWQSNIYPAVGSYWSISNLLGRGALPARLNPDNFNAGSADPGAFPFNYPTVQPEKHPQFGLRLGYQPPGEQLNLALYFESYTDKAPVGGSVADGASGQFSYLPQRRLLGISANFPLGLWAIGTELSYRPHDAVALSSCYLAGGPSDLNTNGAPGDCPGWTDRRKFQWTINSLLSMTPNTHPALNLVGADQAVFTGELSAIKYPGIDAATPIRRTINGNPVFQLLDAGYSTWLARDRSLGYPIGTAKGTARSAGYTLDLNWTYDGTVLPGWQLTPGVTFNNAFSGYTPTLTANYARGARSLNAYVLLTRNPASWQAGINFSAFFGGDSLSQPYADRNYLGAFVTRNF
jgi:hypothetical protein